MVAGVAAAGSAPDLKLRSPKKGNKTRTAVAVVMIFVALVAVILGLHCITVVILIRFRQVQVGTRTSDVVDEKGRAGSMASMYNDDL